MTDDTDLLRRYVRDNSEEAFAELVRRHVDLVYSSALRRVGRDAHLAEDVTQQVFAELARKGRALLTRATLEGWLYTTSRFKAIDAVRTESRRRLREQNSLSMNPAQPGPQGGGDWESLRPLIDSAMDALSEGDREVLLLRYFQSRSFAEVGRMLSLTEDTARKRSSRALERLRAQLARRGLSSATEALALILGNQAIGAAPGGLATGVSGAALASAKGSAVSAVHFLRIMTTIKIAAGAATLALLVASLGTAAFEAREHQRAEDALARARRDTAEAETQLKVLDGQIRDADRGAAALQASIDAAAAADEAAKARRAHPADPRESGRLFSERYPEAQPLLLGHDVAWNALRNNPLFNALGLTPAKREQFLALLAQRADSGITWFTAQDPDAPAFEIGIGQASLSTDQLAGQMRDLLGEDGNQRYQDFTRAGAAQKLAERLTGTLYSTDSPMTQAQAAEMAQVLARSSTDYQSGKNLYSPSQINWETVLSGSQSVLSENQVAALRNLREAIVYEQAADAAANQAQKEAIVAATAALAPKAAP